MKVTGDFCDYAKGTKIKALKNLVGGPFCKASKLLRISQSKSTSN